MEAGMVVKPASTVPGTVNLLVYLLPDHPDSRRWIVEENNTVGVHFPAARPAFATPTVEKFIILSHACNILSQVFSKLVSWTTPSLLPLPSPPSQDPHPCPLPTSHATCTHPWLVVRQPSPTKQGCNQALLCVLNTAESRLCCYLGVGPGGDGEEVLSPQQG